MTEMKPRMEYVKGYSIALLCLGLFFFLGALQFGLMFDGSEDRGPINFAISILCLQGASCLAVFLLRWTRSPAGLPATTALSVALLFAFPIGTVLFFYWLSNVKPKEPSPEDESQSAWFNYTVGLYIAGLLMLDMALVFRFAFGWPGSGSQLLTLFGAGLLVVALAALATGAVRSASLHWGHLATLIFNSLIVLWFPLGTVFALIWFFAVRKHERQVLAEQSPQLAA